MQAPHKVAYDESHGCRRGEQHSVGWMLVRLMLSPSVVCLCESQDVILQRHGSDVTELESAKHINSLIYLSTHQSLP